MLNQRALPHSNSTGPELDAFGIALGALPAHRTLEAVAAMAARLEPHLGCAIAIVENGEPQIAAEHNLKAEDRQILRDLCLTGILTAEPPKTNARACVQIRPLMTQTAEVIGAVCVFGNDCDRGNPQLARQVEEICWIATLVIEQKHLSDELIFRAHHDPLTHLWNRAWIEQEIETVLQRAAKTGQSTGVLAIGIDRFRVINDVLGYQLGNELLRQAAERIAFHLDPSFSLARGGGDEFLVLMPDLESHGLLGACAECLLAAFNDMFEIGDHEIMIRITIGGAIAGPNSWDAQGLLSEAYTALRYAKRQARSRFAKFQPSMITVPPERLVMEQHLRFALQKREFEVYYQPQIDLKTGQTVGVEALLRWKHPSLGFISPVTFIPIAEEIGVIEEIGDWVIDQALHDLQEWRSAGLGRLRMGVNVSALQFARPDFGSLVAQKLRRSQELPEDLEVELTESMLMTRFEQGLRQLRTLRSLGISIAVDDFGTGHSSLAYLQQLPIQRIKLDRVFVRGITNRDERPPLVASIIQMAHALKLSVIAEGIETREQASALAAMGCEEGQGFLFSKPVPFHDLLAWARNRDFFGSELALRALDFYTREHSSLALPWEGPRV